MIFKLILLFEKKLFALSIQSINLFCVVHNQMKKQNNKSKITIRKMEN